MPDKASVLSTMVSALDRLMTRIEGDYARDGHRLPPGKARLTYAQRVLREDAGHGRGAKLTK